MSHVPGGLVYKRVNNVYRPIGAPPIPSEEDVVWNTVGYWNDRYSFFDNDTTAVFHNGPSHGVTLCPGLVSRNSGKKYIEFVLNIDSYFHGGVRQDIGFSTLVPLYEIFERTKFGVFLNGINLGAIAGPWPPVHSDMLFAFAIDFDNGKIWIKGPGGTWGGGAFPIGDPTSGTDPVANITPNLTLFPAVRLEDGVQPAITKLLGNSWNITGPVPSNFQVWGIP